MTAGLFGREILHSTHDLTGGREGDLVCDSRNSKVCDFYSTLGSDEEVSRFDVAVNESRGMRGLQRNRGLSHNVESPIDGKRVFPF